LEKKDLNMYVYFLLAGAFVRILLESFLWKAGWGGDELKVFEEFVVFIYGTGELWDMEGLNWRFYTQVMCSIQLITLDLIAFVRQFREERALTRLDFKLCGGIPGSICFA